METRIIIFGDSITWGAVDTEQGGWVNRMRCYFEADENYEVGVYNLGVSGDNTNNLLMRFDAECSARNDHPQIIIFAIGTNDSQYINAADNPCVAIDEFKDNLTKLVKQAKKYSSKIVFVGLTKVDESKTMPVPWSSENFYNNDNMAKYNSLIRSVCNKYNLPFIDLFDLLNSADLYDGLHPNPAGHKKMFIRIKEFLFANKIV